MPHMESPHIDLGRVSTILGQNVTAAREKRGWTQAELAEQMSNLLGKPFNTSTVNRLEKGNRPTPLTEVFALAELLRVSVNDLLPPQDDLMAVSKALFSTLHDTDSHILRNVRELEELRARRRDLSRAVTAYWVLRRAQSDLSSPDDSARIRDSAALLYDTLFSLGQRMHAYDLADALNLSEEDQVAVMGAIDDESVTPQEVRDIFLDLVEAHFKKKDNGTS